MLRVSKFYNPSPIHSAQGKLLFLSRKGRGNYNIDSLNHAQIAKK
jgi:hypothetical protein